ncbi:MAG TPA: substrate-binding domain-containing protein [Planctomycetota bacterium]|nr:substrate-binding domain-containing protein [Planctomycetota bacterium]
MKALAGVLVVASLAGCGSSEDLTIIPYGRENSSGTHSYFQEHVLGGADYAPTVESLPGTASVVGAVQQDPRAVGYGGIAYLRGVRALKVKKDDGSPAYAPSLENARNGLYPLTRNLYLITVGAPDGAAKGFIGWARSEEGQKICETIGYFPVPAAAGAPAAGDLPAGKQVLTIKGSDTLKILTSLWGERFMQLHPDCRVEVLGGGSEIGIKALLEGDTTICASSRPLRPAEIEEIATKRGKKPDQIVVAVDGLAVFVNEKNPLEELSMAQLKAIYTGKVHRWGDVKNPTP